jgi:hypothetical protein
MLTCNSWRQAQVCMALARASDDPVLRRYYEELTLAFVQNAWNDRDLNVTALPAAKNLATVRLIGLTGEQTKCGRDVISCDNS